MKGTGRRWGGFAFRKPATEGRTTEPNGLVGALLSRMSSARRRRLTGDVLRDALIREGKLPRSFFTKKRTLARQKAYEYALSKLDPIMREGAIRRWGPPVVGDRA